VKGLLPFELIKVIILMLLLTGGFYLTFLYIVGALGLAAMSAFFINILSWALVIFLSRKFFQAWYERLKRSAEEKEGYNFKSLPSSYLEVSQELCHLRRKVVWINALKVFIVILIFQFIYVWMIEPLDAQTKIGLFYTAFQMALGFLLIPLNFMILYGPFLLMALLQIKFLKPGAAKMDVRLEDVRGQKIAVSELKMFLEEFIDPKGTPPRGVLLIGPPGVGKTMFATAAANALTSPIIIAPSSAFVSTFLGVDILTVLFIRWMTSRYLKVYPYVFIFIDEIDLIGFRRGGLVRERSNVSSLAEVLTFGYEVGGAITPCGLSPDYPSYRMESGWQRAWREFVHKYPYFERYADMVRQFPFWGMGPMAIYAFLTWMDGMESPPWFPMFIRSQINAILDALFIPIKISGKIFLPVNWVMRIIGANWRIPDEIWLRLGPVPVRKPRILFMGATNRPYVLDPALTRANRFEEHIHFVMPGVEEREDILELYLSKYAPKLNTPEHRKTLARALVGFSPADIMHVCKKAKQYRSRNLKRISRGEISEKEAENYRGDSETPTLQDFVEAMNTIMFGLKRIDLISQRQKEKTAGHEAGHFIAMKYFSYDSGKKIQPRHLIPTHLSCIPRGDSLGRLAWVPEDERDPQFLEHLALDLRISLGSYAAERILYGTTGPGVGGDFQMAATLAAYMVGFCGMGPFECTEEEEEKYYDIGDYLVAIASVSEKPFLEKVYSRDRKGMRHDAGYRACVLLGQAYADVYRLLLKNLDELKRITKVLEEKEEIVGDELNELYKSISLQPILPTDPLPDMRIASPFYG
jgi:ATP-dependent Zn protease